MNPKTAFIAGFVSCFVLLCVAVTLNGVKAETWGVATLGSRHLDGGNYCEVNPGIGLELSTNELKTSTLVGAYRNSLREDDGSCGTWSAYVGRSYLPLQLSALEGKWRLGGALLAVTGYGSPVTLGAAVVMSYERESRGLRLVWFPNKRGDLMKGVIAMQIAWKWD